MLSVIYAECRYAEFRYAEFRGTYLVLIQSHTSL
jgi:hypothetical protein